MSATTRAWRAFWQERRAEIIARDGGRCVLCGERANLTVHHIRPRFLSQNDSPANLITLCEAHHDRIEYASRVLAAWIVWIIGAPVFALARIVRR